MQLADVADATLDTAYIHFPECGDAEVLAADVRKLGVDAAREACTKTEQNILTGGLAGATAGVLISVLFAYFLSHFGDALKQSQVPAK